MIEKLTKEQEARFPEFIDKWTKIGLCTEPANRSMAEKGVREAYRISGLKPPKKIVWCGSPFSMGLTRALFVETKSSVWASVGASVWASVWASVRDSVRASVWASVRDSVGDSVGASVYGQHDANWIGFYDYFRLVCGLSKETEKLCGSQMVAENAGWWLPHKNICWISERHNILHRNTQERLHKDEGPALAYPDGWCIYALNGVRMKADYVLTPAEKLDVSAVLKEENADIRRELIRKIGIERFLEKAPHKTLDTQGNYKLLAIELSPEIKDARYLKMLNPSIGTWHVEGVHPTCKTVQEAINWRANNDINKQWNPTILT